jgi:hypothetical protein
MAAKRAFTAARMHRSSNMSLQEAAESCGSNIMETRAMSTLNTFYATLINRLANACLIDARGNREHAKRLAEQVTLQVIARIDEKGKCDHCKRPFRPCTHKSGRPHRARQLPPLAPSKLRCIFSTS